MKLLENRRVFNGGLLKLVELKRPERIIVAGLASYPIFHEVEDAGIEIVQIDEGACSRFKSSEPNGNRPLCSHNPNSGTGASLSDQRSFCFQLGN